jgi:hypothetical protein
MAFSLENRAAILDQYFPLYQRNYVIGSRTDFEHGKTLYALWLKYREGVPVKFISVCPFTHQALLHSIDDFGLDGLWWNNELPARPAEDVEYTFYALDGALEIGSSIEQFPFLCSPGPAVPFVLPRLLQNENIRAVLSSMKIGCHRAYLICYFSKTYLPELNRVNEFGLDFYRIHNLDSTCLKSSYYDYNRDFSLEEWIRQGKLLWIRPDDAQLILHSTVSDCPYCGLKGTKNQQYIQNGKLWEGKTGSY